MRGLRRSGARSGTNAAADAAQSAPVPASPVQGAVQAAQPGGSAVRRRRRRRRIVIAAPFLVVLSWAVVSYTAWMLQPTSMSCGERSAEWVRSEVPFGNWLVDEAEHIYYTLNAPKTGGPQLKSLPAVGLNRAADQPRRSRRPLRGRRRSSRSSRTRSPAKGSGSRPGRPSTAARRCS